MSIIKLLLKDLSLRNQQQSAPKFLRSVLSLSREALFPTLIAHEITSNHSESLKQTFNNSRTAPTISNKSTTPSEEIYISKQRNSILYANCGNFANNFIDVDRGVSTMADGYSTTAEMEKLVDYYFNKNSQEDLRNGVIFLLQHYGLLRGESLRMMELPDLQCMLLENEGISPCYALVMVLKQGKTNQEGRLEFAACLRNKNVRVCPQMMLSFYLLYRWHIAGEPFPDFDQNRDWFDIKLCRSKRNLKEAISYDHHLNCIKAAFKAVGLNSKAKTHAMRGSGSRMAEMLGTSEGAIRRLGRWNNSALTTSYLTHLPREALRTMAGFTRDAGQFYLVRSSVVPSEELCKLVFPRVDYWQEMIRNEEVLEGSTAADGFLQLLVQLRVVFLQDSVVMKKLYPNHSI